MNKLRDNSTGVFYYNKRNDVHNVNSYCYRQDNTTHLVNEYNRTEQKLNFTHIYIHREERDKE